MYEIGCCGDDSTLKVQGEYCLYVSLVKYLSQAGIHRGKPADNTLVTCDRLDYAASRSITDSQEEIQHCQAAENKLQSTIMLKSSIKHYHGEQTPE